MVTTPTIHIARDRYHLAWDPAIEPIESVDSGGIVEFDCLDASGGQLGAGSTVDDLGRLDFDRVDQVNGPIEVRGAELDAALDAATVAMGATSRPQILITIAARFGRLSWKYSSIAYGLILKDVGVLLQTFYLMATDIGLGGCAVGSTNIQLFARMTGIDFHVEGAVGQFALGRGAAPARSD